MRGSSHSSDQGTPDDSLISIGCDSTGWENKAFFIPSIVSEFKRTKLFGPISTKAGLVIEGNGRDDAERLAVLPPEIVPIIGCTYDLRGLIRDWLRTGRNFIYWDRGYVSRGGTAWLPTGHVFYRWELNGYQMTRVRPSSPERWNGLRQGIHPWRKNGRHIVVAVPSDAYLRFHELDGWLERVTRTANATGRKVTVRHKKTRVPLGQDLLGAHCLVTHGSVAAVEAVILGCPVFVDGTSAAAPVGKTDLDFENPVTPDRTAWLHSLASSQFTLNEIITGKIWEIMRCG